MAGKKKALVFSSTLATFGVDKVPERRKYGMSDPSGLESEKEKDCDFQPTKKWRTKPSASKGKQSTSLKRYCWGRGEITGGGGPGEAECATVVVLISFTIL